MGFVIRALVLFALMVAPAAAAEIAVAESALAHGDYEKAATTLERLAGRGQPEALYLLGTLYANGDGVPQDDGKALHYFRDAAAKGHKLARQQIVAMFRMGALASPPPEDWRIQLATVGSPQAGEKEWRRLLKVYGEVLNGVPYVAIPQDDKGRTVYRVQGGPLDEAVARAICADLKDTSQGCRVVKAPPPEAEAKPAAEPPAGSAQASGPSPG